MKQVKVKLSSIDDVRNFVTKTSNFKTEIDLVEGRYIIDAKSILGIFSLDLQKPIMLRIVDDKEAPEVVEALSEFIVEE